MRVQFLDQILDPYSGKPWNLHAVWDSGILERYLSDARQYADHLDTWLRHYDEEELQSGTAVDWVMEAHDIARDHVYRISVDHKIDYEYFRSNVPIVDEQLAKAGVRLAKLLNDALGKQR